MPSNTRIAWAGLLLSSLALAAPVIESKDVIKVDGHERKEIIIEADDGNVNIYINEVVATVTVPGCAGGNTATEIAATPYITASSHAANSAVVYSALPQASTYTIGSSGSYNAGSSGSYNSGSSASYNAVSSSSSWVAESAPYKGSEPDTVLEPVNPGIPFYAHPSACAPLPSATLYYGQQTSTTPGQPIASAAVLEIPSLVYPAVNAHLAESITSVVCNGSSATVTFANSAAYDVAVSSWTKPLTLISYSDSCGTGTDGTHDFLLVQQVSEGPSGSLTLNCAITIIDFEQAVGADTEMTVTIGHHTNGTSSGSGTGTTSGGSDSTTNGTVSGNSGTNGTTSSTNGTTSGNATTTANTGTCLAGAFDEALDNAKGNDVDLADPAVWDSIAPGLTAADWDGNFEVDDLPDVDDDLSTSARRRKRSLRRKTALRSRDAALRKRGLGSWLKSKYNNFAKNNPIVRLPTTDEVGSFLERKAREALGVLNDWTSVNKDLSKDLSFNNYPTNGISPFQNNKTGYKFYDKEELQAWCVGCGADSSLKTTGRITFSIAKGFTNGNVRLFGGFNAGLNVGLIGKISKQIPIAETTFVTVTLGDFLLPGILKLGPSVRVGAGSFVVFDAVGELYTGVAAKWPNVDISLDVLNVASSYANGLTPTIDTNFETKGEISVTVDTHLTLAVGLTVGIMSDKFSRSVEVIDQPGVQVTAGVQGSVSFNGGFSSAFTGECKGISLAAKVYNNVTADILKLTTKELAQWTSPTISKCFTLAGSEAASAGSSTGNSTASVGSNTGNSTASAGSSTGNSTTSAGASTGNSTDPTTGTGTAPVTELDPTTGTGDDATSGTGDDTTTGAGDDTTTGTGDDTTTGTGDDTTTGTSNDRTTEESLRKRREHKRDFMKSLSIKRETASNATGEVNLNTTSAVSTENVGESFTPMASTDGFFELHWSPEGNIYVLPSNGDSDSTGDSSDDTSISSGDESNLFGTLQVDDSGDKIIVGDSDGRIFHAYSDEFDKYGVSRIRLHEADFLPATALAVAFSDANDSNTNGTTSDALVAADTAENIYYPVVCVYDSCYPKLFLVKDPYTGPGILQNLTELTGEANLDCGFLPLLPQIY